MCEPTNAFGSQKSLCLTANISLIIKASIIKINKFFNFRGRLVIIDLPSASKLVC